MQSKQFVLLIPLLRSRETLLPPMYSLGSQDAIRIWQQSQWKNTEKQRSLSRMQIPRMLRWHDVLAETLLCRGKDRAQKDRATFREYVTGLQHGLPVPDSLPYCGLGFLASSTLNHQPQIIYLASYLEYVCFVFSLVTMACLLNYSVISLFIFGY